MIDILGAFRKTGTDTDTSAPAVLGDATTARGRVIAVANEKGGCGKSTMAMHLAVSLLKRGLSVATLDLDLRQGSLSRYVANRRRYAEAAETSVPMSEHLDGNAVIGGDASNEAKSLERLRYVIDGSRANSDVLIIDTPGSDTPFGRLTHRLADLILTPVNDSFIDLDVLAQIDPHRRTVVGPSAFATMILSDRQVRTEEGRSTAPWLVARNRLGTLQSHNSRDVEWALEKLEQSFALQVIPGFSERVIFRELFLVGLTILDLKDASGGKALSRSHLAAREEVFALTDSVLERLPERPGTPT